MDSEQSRAEASCFSNIFASASDLFQARKSILVSATSLSFVGAAIAPGSQSIGRLIAAQTLNGASNASMALTYTIPSEILPTKWRSSKHARCFRTLRKADTNIYSGASSS